MLNKFIDYLNEQVENHSIYVWGGQGQGSPVISTQWIRRMETSETNARRAINFWQKQVEKGYGNVLKAFDCSGLGVYFFLQYGLIKNDMTSDNLLNSCRRITKNELRPGDFVFKVNSNNIAYHMGYITDEEKTVIQAKGRDYGVVRGSIENDIWNAFGRPYFFDDDYHDEIIITRYLKLKSPYMRGDDVLKVQKRLNVLGYYAGTEDGIFGRNTRAAVRNFQSAAGLSVDGIVGPRTCAALGFTFDFK